MLRRLLSEERGQASTELLGTLWWLLLVALAVWQLLLAAWAVDQAANAATLATIGAAQAIAQSAFTADRLTAELVDLFTNPGKLTAAASAAKSAGIHDAAERLADIVIATAART